MLVLWDIDHTLIDNGGVSKANYRLAYQLLVGTEPAIGPETDGRTDVAIMGNMLEANGHADRWSTVGQLEALAEAGRQNADLMRARGWALPGARQALETLAASPMTVNPSLSGSVISSVLTGNIEPNARVKLGAFDLARWIDWRCGAFGSESAVRAELVPIARAKAADVLGYTGPAVLIGDTDRDVAAGLEGGARVIAVATGGQTTAELAAAGADIVLPHLVNTSALLSALAQLAGADTVSGR